MTGDIINIIFTAVGILIAAGIIIRIIKAKCSAERRIDVSVIDKQTYTQTVMSKSQAPFENKRYVITFLNGDKKLTFYVSHELYNRCEINQTGTLIYKGLRIIDFC